MFKINFLSTRSANLPEKTFLCYIFRYTQIRETATQKPNVLRSIQNILNRRHRSQFIRLQSFNFMCTSNCDNLPLTAQHTHALR